MKDSFRFVFFSAIIAAILFFSVSVGWSEGDSTLLVEKVSPLAPSSMTLFEDSEVFTGYINYHNKKGKFWTMAPRSADLSKSWDYQDSVYAFDASDEGVPKQFFTQLAAADAGRFIDPASNGDPYNESVACAFFRLDGKVIVEIFHDGERWGEPLELDGVSVRCSSLISVDLKVADMDLLQDEKGQVHDEIIVARTGGGYGESVYIDVIKVNPTNGKLTIVATDQWESAYTSGQLWLPFMSEFVSLTTGDYNGDKFPDFSVSVAESNFNYCMEDPCTIHPFTVAYDFAHSDTNLANKKLQLQKHPGKYIKINAPSNMDAAAGDFDGDGSDEILLVYESSFQIAYTILRADENWEWSDLSNHGIKTNYPPAKGTLTCATGHFIFDPENGFDLNKKQVAVCWRSDDNLSHNSFLVSHIHDPSDFSKPMTLLGENVHAADPNIFTNGISKYKIGNFAIDVGNFVGHQGNASSPQQQLIVHAMWGEFNIDINPCTAWWHTSFIYQMDTRGELNYVTAHTTETWPGCWPDSAIMAAACDSDGDSWVLGGPSHLVIEDVVSLDYMIQEPPKHLDYLPLDPRNPEGDWDVINVSAFSDFNMEYEKESEQSVTNKNINTSTWTIGGATEYSVSAAAEAPAVTVSAEDKIEIGYNYNSKKSSYNSSYHERTHEFSAQTNFDDSLHGTLKLFHVWRYPILNYKSANTEYPLGIYDIIFPFNQQEFTGGGMAHSDWYQPLHENRNILSYPQYDMKNFPDNTEVGCFNSSGSSGQVCGKPMNKVQEFILGNAGTEKMIWTETAGAGASKEYTHTLKKNASISASFKVGKTTVAGGAEAKVSYGVSFHNKNSWGGAAVEECTSSNSQGITLQKPAKGRQDLAYGFETAVYTAADGGAFTVAHAVNPLASASTSDLWKQYYNQKPDPALNLPNKFVFHGPEGDHLWTLNTDETKKQMRGFFLRSSTPNELSDEYPLLAEAPRDGDIVHLCVRIYNYSLEQPTGNFNVKFYYYPWDTQHAKALGDPVSQPAMTATVSLDGVQTPYGTSMKEVWVPWNTSGLSTEYGINVGYRFLVVLDEDNKVDEIHEYKDEKGDEVPGGNNAGYWPWQNAVVVMSPPSLLMEAMVNPLDASMQDDSLEIETDDGLISNTSGYTFETGQTYRLRAHMTNDGAHSHFRHVFFYEGDPEADGKAFASQLSFGMQEQDTYIWTEWTPRTEGETTLHAKFSESQEDISPGNASDSLLVTVVNAAEKDNDDSGCFCSILK